jgi:hypothetical protein
LAKLYVKLLSDSQLFGSISNYRATFTATFSICHDLSHVNRRGCTVCGAHRSWPGYPAYCCTRVGPRPACRAWCRARCAHPGGIARSCPSADRLHAAVGPNCEASQPHRAAAPSARSLGPADHAVLAPDALCAPPGVRAVPCRWWGTPSRPVERPVRLLGVACAWAGQLPPRSGQLDGCS